MTEEETTTPMLTRGKTSALEMLGSSNAFKKKTREKKLGIQENKKSPDVELDTDGVQEQLVEVEEQKVESTEPELPREEVDLGYTEPKPAGIEGIQIEQTEEKL